MPGLLFQAVLPALTTLLGSVDGLAKSGVPVFSGSPGSIARRKNQHGVEYYVHRYYGGDGTQREVYLGRIGESEESVASLRTRIDEVKALLPELRLLILAALGEKFPGAIETALADLPVSARKYVTHAATSMLALMEGHPRAVEEFEGALDRCAAE